MCSESTNAAWIASRTGTGRARIFAGSLIEMLVAATRPPPRACCSGGSCAIAPGSRSASSPVSRAERTAPRIATPNEPPSDRKNVAAAVPAPMSRSSTAFCTARISDCMHRPSPTPITTM